MSVADFVGTAWEFTGTNELSSIPSVTTGTVTMDNGWCANGKIFSGGISKNSSGKYIKFGSQAYWELSYTTSEKSYFGCKRIMFFDSISAEFRSIVQSMAVQVEPTTEEIICSLKYHLQNAYKVISYRNGATVPTDKNLKNLSGAIDSIPIKKTEQEKTSTITTNGTTEITPDSGKVLSKVTVTTNVKPTLQEKTVTPTTTSQTITPDSGKDGLSKVTVNAVTSGIDSNITAENIKKNVTILGVTGTLESGGGSNGTPIDVATEQEMASILSNATAEDSGKIYRYTGTTGTYVNGALYWLEVPQQSTYSVNITTSQYVFTGVPEPGMETKIKFDGPPTSEDDYDFYVNSTGNIVTDTGATSFTGKKSIYAWGNLHEIIVNGVTHSIDTTYDSSTEIVLTSDSNVTAYYYSGQSVITPTLISFDIAGTPYQAETGMTWEQWVGTSYNKDGYIITGVSNDYIGTVNMYVFMEDGAQNVKKTDEIIGSYHYKLGYSSGGGAN